MTQTVGTAPDSDEGRSKGAVVFFIALSTAAMGAISIIWLALWAINKPVHPDACGEFRGAECMAAISGHHRP